MEKNKISKYNNRWVIIITVSTVILAAFFSFVSDTILQNLNIYFAFLTLIVIIMIGVLADIIGVAAAVADEKHFHAMASKKIEIAYYCLFITRNAAKVSSFCSDVIGDIAGIISGGAGTIIVINLIRDYGLGEGFFLTVIMSSMIAGLTVGGKAIGKDVAINKANKIVLSAARVLKFIHRFFKFKV
jgi:CBS domain containing-hemolysin-like protein